MIPPVNPGTAASVTKFDAVFSRSDSPSFRHTITGSVHDALWMLTTQWKHGEFNGHDCGSLVYTSTKVKTARLNMTAKVDGTGAKVFNNSIPYEATIEAEPVPVDLSLRLQMGRFWLKLLKHYETAFSAEIRTKTIIEFPIKLVVATAYEDISNKEANDIRISVNNRFPDGYDLYSFLFGTGDKTVQQLYAKLGVTGTTTAVDTAVGNALIGFKAYYKDFFFQPATEADMTWRPARLEYEAMCTTGIGTNQEAFVSKEYLGGRLEWYAFDRAIGTSVTEVTGVVDDTSVLTKSHIPSPIHFAGMPSARRYEMEDAKYNYASLRSTKTDSLGLLIQDTILTFNSEWLLVPYTIPAGSLSKVESIIATDVFGDKIYIGGALDNVSSQNWSMYHLSNNNDMAVHGDKLFIPPSVPGALEGEVIEKVNFIRDQMANMAWAVELNIPNDLGGGKDGYSAAKELVDYLRSLTTEAENNEIVTENGVTPPYGVAGQSYSMLKYKLLTQVPENWIPLTPAADNDDNIRLQRATLPRLIFGELMDASSQYKLIRPRGAIMRTGLATSSPYFIYEEEVPRAGAIVTRNYQRARWLNGKTVLWLGRKKTTGTGEGLSSLRYDIVESATLVNK